MKWLNTVFCLFFGHNKILKLENDFLDKTHHTVCSQCQKKWDVEKLKDTTKIGFKKYTIKIRAYGKTIVIKKIPKEVLLTKQKVNFYAL